MEEPGGSLPDHRVRSGMIEDGRLLALLSIALRDVAQDARFRSQNLIASSIRLRKRSDDLLARRNARL